MGSWSSAEIDRSIRERTEPLRAALEKIATVIGEDDPEILWPWAQEVAREALKTLPPRLRVVR